MQHENKHGDHIFLLHYFNVLCNCARFNKKGITLICRTISYCWLSTFAASNGNKQGLMTNEVKQGEVMKVCILTHEGSPRKPLGSGDFCFHLLLLLFFCSISYYT